MAMEVTRAQFLSDEEFDSWKAARDGGRLFLARLFPLFWECILWKPQRGERSRAA